MYVFTWVDVGDVPPEQAIYGAVNEHHATSPREAEPPDYTMVSIVPLYTDCLLLEVGYQLAAVTEGTCGRQTLKQSITTTLSSTLRYWHRKLTTISIISNFSFLLGDKACMCSSVLTLKCPCLVKITPKALT